jgi:hypothetical protein
MVYANTPEAMHTVTLFINLKNKQYTSKHNYEYDTFITSLPKRRNDAAAASWRYDPCFLFFHDPAPSSESQEG